MTEPEEPTRRQRIFNTVEDLVSGFLFYDRKEDDDLPRGAIEEAVKQGEITWDEIGARFTALIKQSES